MSIRIKLKKGKQKELIETVKNKSNLTWKSLSKKLNCGENYLLHELRNEKRTLAKENYEKLCKLGKINFDGFIIAELNGNWGQVKGGRSVKNRKNLFKEKNPKILCEPSAQLAEAIGILIGDGSIYTIPEKSIYQVHVAGNLSDEKEYLLNYVKPLFEEVFNLKMNVKKTKNALYVWKQSKDLVFTLKKYGLPIGNKKINNIKIPFWVMSNQIFLKNCLRGIFDTDGCIYPKNKTNLYPTIWISSAIPSLRISITQSCRKLGFNLSKWKNYRNDAYIDRKEEVLRFFNEIKFNNPKHLIRWNKFNRLPSSSPVNSSSIIRS